MTVIALTFFLLLTNCITSPDTNVTTLEPAPQVNKLPEGSTKEVVALQSEENRTTSEVAPGTSPGNNSNVVDAHIPSTLFDAQTENSQAISTIYTFENKKSTGENNDENLLPVEAFDENVFENKGSSKTSLPLVWDDCFETNFRDSYLHLLKTQYNKEILNQIIPTKRNILEKKSGDNVSKRDIVNANDSDAVKSWLEKYNKLKKEQVDDRKYDSIFIRKITQPTNNTNLISTFKVLPITRPIFLEPTLSYNTTLDVVSENNIESSYTEDWFEAEDRTKIRFGGLPQTETYLIPTLKMEEGFYPFSFMTDFFSLIYPFDFPIDLVKDIVWGNLTFPDSFLQSLKVESTFLAFIIIFACIALVIPIYLLVLAISSLFANSRSENEMETGALFPEEKRSKCNDSVVLILTLLVLLFCWHSDVILIASRIRFFQTKPENVISPKKFVLISSMAVTNEQARIAAADSRNLINCVCADVASWLSVAARELHHSLVPPMDLVHNAFKDDLKNVKALLGEPIQTAIASESGIDLVFDSLADIITESEDLSIKITLLRDVSVRAGGLAAAASERIKDLARQLDNLKKHCSEKDSPLCDTINTNALEVQMKFDLILREQQLHELRTLGVDNLTRAISTARQEFRTLPSAISSQTKQVREEILKDIENRRQAVYSSSKILTDIVRHLTSGLHTVARKMETGLARAIKFEFWRWIIMIACLASFALVMTLILAAILCGCGQAKSHAKRTLQLSSIWLCFTSLVLWSVVSAIFLIAGHAEIFICHALWDSPQYSTISALLDRPSPLLEDNQSIFDAFFTDLENVTIDVSVRDVLRDCEKDQPAYIVFQLDKVLDVNKVTSYFEWEELQADLETFASAIDVRFLKTISANFSALLNDILVVSDVDLAKYRMDYNNPVVGRDIPSLVDQIENIAVQAADLNTAGRLETLATRTQRLYVSNIKPLEQMRADLVFKLTELELQLLPFRKKLNISLSHIHTAQYYIDNQGEIIAQKKVAMFVSRLTSHVAGWRTHALTSATGRAARCRPLYTVYSAARALLCTRYLSSLHGWWFCGAILGICWCTTLTPLCVQLWRAYGRKIRTEEDLALANLSTSQQDTPATAVCDSGDWNTPRPPPPPRNDSW